MYKQLAGGFGGIQATKKSMEEVEDVNIFLQIGWSGFWKCIVSDLQNLFIWLHTFWLQFTNWIFSAVNMNNGTQPGQMFDRLTLLHAKYNTKFLTSGDTTSIILSVMQKPILLDTIMHAQVKR